MEAVFSEDVNGAEGAVEGVAGGDAAQVAAFVPFNQVQGGLAHAGYVDNGPEIVVFGHFVSCFKACSNGFVTGYHKWLEAVQGHLVVT